MTDPLPTLSSLLGPLATLERALTNFEATLSGQTILKQSADLKISVVVNGLGRVVSVSIAPDLLQSSDAATLASAVRTVANSALSAAITQSQPTAESFASTLSLPGLPAQNAAPPNFLGFSSTVDLISQTVLARIPCNRATQFQCRSGPVSAVMTSNRQIVTLTFDSPLPEFAPYLETSTVLALNCAIDASDHPPQDPHDGSGGIVGNGVGFKDLVLYAQGELKIDNGVKIMAEGCVDFGAVGNAGPGPQTFVGVSADVGAIYSRPKVFLSDGGRIHGVVRTEADFQPQNSDPVKLKRDVVGPIIQHTPVALPTLSVSPQFPATAQNGISLEPNTPVTTAGPAYYRFITIKRAAVLKVSTGVYYTDDFLLDQSGIIQIDASAGPVYFWVKNSFIFRGSFVDLAGGFPRVWVGYLSASQAAIIETAFRGSIVAPNTKINLGTVGTPAAPGHTGSFHGKDVEANANMMICHRPFEVPFQDIPGVRPAAGPQPSPTPAPGAATTAVLGFEDAAAWTSHDATLSLVGSPISQGGKALSVANLRGFTAITSRAFNSTGLTVPTTKLRVDLWIPAVQPNPFWWGELRLQISIPSAGINGLELGIAPLTGLPQSRFTTLEFVLPATVKTAITSGRSDVTLTVILNVNPGVGTHFLDNLRFA